MTMRTVLLDIDGTLIDSNDAHANAWMDAFRECGIQAEARDVRRSIGMGGDKLMPAVASVDAESPEGQRIAERRGAIFASRYLPTLQPLPGARDLVVQLKERGFTAVAASSATEDELKALLDIIGVLWLLDGRTSSDDADESKPAPDIIQAALKRGRSQPQDAVMIGDTPYDIEAAGRAGVRTIAFRSGGWSDADLDGAVAIYDGPAHLLAEFDDSPLC